MSNQVPFWAFNTFLTLTQFKWSKFHVTLIVLN